MEQYAITHMENTMKPNRFQMSLKKLIHYMMQVIKLFFTARGTTTGIDWSG